MEPPPPFLMLAGGLPLMSTAHAQTHTGLSPQPPRRFVWPSAAQWRQSTARSAANSSRCAAARRLSGGPGSAEYARSSKGLKNP